MSSFLFNFPLLLIPDIGTGFPYLLASQYFLAGLGAVLGVLTSAFATTILREETFFQSAAVAAVTGATDAGDEGDDAPEGEASEDSGEDQACNSTTHNRSSLLVVNSGSGDLILRQGERELLSN